MSNLHRILWIDGQIRGNKYPNCRIIAQRFEISPRQASRDVEYLRYSLDAPIAYCAKNNGYYYQGDTFVLPAHFLSREEKDTLGFLAYQYRSMGSGQAEMMASLFARLSGEAGGEEGGKLPVFTPAPEEVRAFRVLVQAMKAEHKVEMEYVNASGNDSRRVFSPYKIFCQGRIGYVAGYCESREDIRVFRLARIRRIQVLEDKFQVVSWFDPEQYKDGFDYREPYQAVVRAISKEQLMTAGLQVLPQGQDYLVKFTDSDKLLSSLLAGVDSFSILAPRWLKQRFYTRLNKLFAANYPLSEGCDIICPAPPDTMEPSYTQGGVTVVRKLDVDLGMSWTTYIGSVDGALRKAGLWDGEIYKLSGTTGMAFHFIIHKTACPSSVTVYDWAIEHFAMMDRIGIHTETIQAFKDPKLNTFRLIQEDAAALAKASIDRGVPAVTWAPTGMLEFGLITGYDAQDEVLFVKDCVNADPDPLLYTNLGISEVPYLYVQTFKGKVEVDPEKIFRDSLEFGLGEWKKEQQVSPDYASGRKAYSYLISTLERGDFDDFGLSYILSVYADSKACIARYLADIAAQSRELKGLDEAAQLYRQVAENYKELTRLVPFMGPGSGSLDRSVVPQVLDLVRQCLDQEERAMTSIESVLRR